MSISNRHDFTAIDQLLRSHRRLEDACDALAIASSDRDIDTAVDVSAFFERQVRRHEEDEESSLFPRLLSSSTPPISDGLRALIERLSAEHREHEALGARLARVTSALRDQKSSDSLWTELETVAELLARGYRAHIEQEESQLFPEARTLLSASALEEMSVEMDARRGRDRGARKPPA